MSIKSDIIDSLVNEDMASLYGKFSNSLISNAISKSVDDAIEVILDCEVDTIKIDGNFDDICSCIDYVYDTLLGDKKKYGISRVTNKDVTSITFDIVL